MTTTIETPTTAHGDVIDIALNRLKKSERNARKTPHSPADIEALAASIKAKGILQPPVVEPELDAEGQPTGNYLVTIGEGRRQAQLLRVKRKEIRKTEPITCRVDLTNDPHEISLDENVTRSNMHPADQFEAFQRLADERGMGAEEIAARFGVTATVVRQRLRLASVSPTLMAGYRNGDLTLEQLMAFTVTDDHARQDAIWEGLSDWERRPAAIRRRLAQDRVRARDRRAVYVGSEAYEAAGGIVERDLFAEDGGGYFASPALLDQLALDRLHLLAEVVTADGWAWAEVSLDHPDGHGLGRLYPQCREFTEEEAALHATLSTKRDALQAEDWSEGNEARLKGIADEIRTMEQSRFSFDDDTKAHSGAFVSVGQDGKPRIEYGFVRLEAVVQSDDGEGSEADPADDPKPTKRKPADRPALPDTLVAELTAHRTMALRNALAEQPEVALFALIHALVLRTFSVRSSQRSCLDVRPLGTELSGYAPGIDDSVAGRKIAERHGRWAMRLETADDPAAFIDSLGQEERLDLLAHCASLTVNDVEMKGGTRTAVAPGASLARRVGLDMAAYWWPTTGGYFARVNKAKIIEAVTEAVSEDAARRISGAKKAEMAEAAEGLVAGVGWLPEPLRLPEPPTEAA